jgi:hypothetical protein
MHESTKKITRRALAGRVNSTLREIPERNHDMRTYYSKELMENQKMPQEKAPQSPSVSNPSADHTGKETTRREFLQGSAVLAGSLLAGSAGVPLAAQGRPRQPNIVFFLGEGQRFDALSIAGNPILKTPNHDRIGREGMMFRNAFCTNALCAPARATLLTGLYSRSSGALDNKYLQVPLPADIPLFTDLLRGAGYEIAIVGKVHINNGVEERHWDYYFGHNAPSNNYVQPLFKEGHDGRWAKNSTTKMSTLTILPSTAPSTGLRRAEAISPSACWYGLSRLTSLSSAPAVTSTSFAERSFPSPPPSTTI